LQHFGGLETGFLQRFQKRSGRVGVPRQRGHTSLPGFRLLLKRGSRIDETALLGVGGNEQSQRDENDSDGDHDRSR
jgi:hypothetical protein